MNTIQQLTTQAVNASQTGNWQEGKEANESIVALEPDNIAALNRLAFCEMQLGNTKQAKKLYEQVLEKERHNSIALKYMELLNQKVQLRPTVLANHNDFIEEPGKTKLVTLQRLADPDILQSIPTATECGLVVKNHRVNIVTNQEIYLGSLPDDIAFRLQKLIQGGNKYRVLVQSTSKKHVTVFIKESFRSAECAFATSFPLTSKNQAPVVTADEVMAEDETPMETTDESSEEHDTSGVPPEDFGDEIDE